MAINDNNFGVNKKNGEWEYLGRDHDEKKEEKERSKKPLKNYQAIAKAKAKKNKMVKVMGHEVREGSKKHQNLVADKKHYDDLASSER